MLSFDTEDYTNPYSDQAILSLAQIMIEEEVTGCFNVVGALATVLQSRGRQDVITALQAHHIGYHTKTHTWHPTVVEYTDAESWDDGYNRFLEEESSGIALVKNVFDLDRIWGAVPAGNCIAAPAIYGYAALGIPIYSGSLFHGTQGRSIWYCNALNLENNAYLDHILLTEGLDGIRSRIDMWAQWERLIMCCHPNIIVNTQFWDALNLQGTNQVVWGAWKLPPKRPPAVVIKFYADLKEAIRLFKQHGGFEFVTYRDIWDARVRQQPIALARLRELLPGACACRVDAVWGANTYSYADLFRAAVHFLSGRTEDYVPLDVVGPVYEPAAVTAECRIDADLVRQAARCMVANSTIPHQTALGDVMVGPMDYLGAAAQVLEGKTLVSIRPQPQVPDLTGLYQLDAFKLQGTWMHSVDFADRWVTKRLRQQAWTVRMEAQ
jgi:hypothetical protein